MTIYELRMKTEKVQMGLRVIATLFISGFTSYVNGQSLTEEYNECAIECFQQKEYDSAIYFYTEIISMNPQDENAYFDRGFVKDLIEDYDGAISDFTHQIAIDSEHVDSYFLRGMIWEKKKEFTKAIQDYSSVIHLEDGNADAHYFRGILKELMKDDQGAFIDYSDAIRVNPEHSDAYTHRAWIKIKQKDFLAAEKDLAIALNIDSTNVQSYYYLGFIQAENHSFDAAISNYLKAIRLNPFFELDYPIDEMKKHKLTDYTSALKKLITNQKSSSTQGDLALLFLYLNQIDQAMVFCNNAITFDTIDAKNFCFRSRIHLKRSKLLEALTDLNYAIELNPNNALFYYKRALIYMSLGETKKACSDYETEIRLEGFAHWWILPSPCAN